MMGSVLGPAKGPADSHGKNAGLIRGDKAPHCGGGRVAWARAAGVIPQLAHDAMGGWEMSQLAESLLGLVQSEDMASLGQRGHNGW